jgi:hypothetical protein
LHRRDLAERLRLELRVEHGGELIQSRLSRFGEAPLLLIADQLKANLIEQGCDRSAERDMIRDTTGVISTS